jgi:type IV secretory pathway TraG/TraD family ATPase VirD4
VNDLARITALMGARPVPATSAAPIASPVTAEPAPTALSVPAHTPALRPSRPPLKLGNVPIPEAVETGHILLIGTTGAGKSQALIGGILTPIRMRDDSAIIMDNSAEFLMMYYDETKDLIFNPGDERSVGWSSFNEIYSDMDFMKIARGLVPDGHGDSKFWNGLSQLLLSCVMRALWNKGEDFRCNGALMYFIVNAPVRGIDNPRSLENLVQGSPCMTLFEEGSEKMLGNARTIAGAALAPFGYMKAGDFSITKFVREFGDPAAPRRWLFLSYTDANYAAFRILYSLMLSYAIQAGLSLPKSSTRRFYFVIDEFASLEKIDAIVDGLTKMRKRGGVIIAGIQSTAQLTHAYESKEVAQTILSCFNTLLMLRVSDDETAEKLSLQIGDGWRDKKTMNEGQNTGKDVSTSTGSSTTQELKRLILPGVFMGLENLQGFVRISGDKTPYRTAITYCEMPTVTVAEIPVLDYVLRDS